MYLTPLGPVIRNGGVGLALTQNNYGVVPV